MTWRRFNLASISGISLSTLCQRIGRLVERGRREMRCSPIYSLGNDLIIADALDTNFENYVDVVGFFDPADTDTLEFVFDINGNGIQIS
jgi:hypothetical protein